MQQFKIDLAWITDQIIEAHANIHRNLLKGDRRQAMFWTDELERLVDGLRRFNHVLSELETLGRSRERRLLHAQQEYEQAMANEDWEMAEMWSAVMCDLPGDVNGHKE